MTRRKKHRDGRGRGQMLIGPVSEPIMLFNVSGCNRRAHHRPKSYNRTRCVMCTSDLFDAHATKWSGRSDVVAVQGEKSNPRLTCLDTASQSRALTPVFCFYSPIQHSLHHRIHSTTSTFSTFIAQHVSWWTWWWPCWGRPHEWTSPTI